MHTFEQGVLLAPTKKSFAIGRGKRPSPREWHLICVIGDGVLLLSLFVLVLALAPYLYLELRVWPYELGTWDTKLVWGILSFIAWGVAVKITEAQETGSISGRLKSPLCAVFAILLVAIFWMIFTYP